VIAAACSLLVLQKEPGEWSKHFSLGRQQLRASSTSLVVAIGELTPGTRFDHANTGV